MKKLIFLLTLGTMCVLPALMAFADEPIVAEVSEVSETPEVMDKVIVTAGRIEESQRTVTQATTIIPREEIEKSQYTDLGGILRNYGIQVDMMGNQGFSQVAIRGVRNDLFGDDLRGGVLLLVDGRRVGTANVSMIPMVNIERVEIIRGPGSVQYGSSAIGGVINVITRRGPGVGKDLAARVEVGGGSFETYKTEAELAGRKDKVDFSSGISWIKTHDYKTGDGHTYYNTGLDYKLGYSANLGYNFTDEHRIGATVLGVRNEDAGSSNDIRFNDHTAYTDRNNYSMDFVYDGGYKDWGLNWKGRYYNGHVNYLIDEPDGAFGSYHGSSETDYNGAQGQLSWNKSFFTLTGGVDYLDYDITDTSQNRSKYYNTGAFMLGKLAFFDDFVILSAGARQDYYDLNYQGEKDDFNHTTPSVGIALNPTNWLTFRGNYGESYRVPSAVEVTGGNYYGNNYISNPNLDPEEGKSWDMGVEVNHKSLNLGLTYFSTDYENKIADRDVGAGIKQYYNLDGTVTYQGLEAQASYDVGEFFEWSFVLRPYLNLTTMFKYEDYKGETLKNVSKHNIAYGLNFDHTDWGLAADLRFTYYGKQRQSDFSTPPLYPPQPDVTVGPTTLVDLFVTKQIYDWVDVGTLSVKGEIRNMFDEDYDLTYSFPMPGRSFYVGFQYEY